MICRHRDISLLRRIPTPSQSNPTRWPPDSAYYRRYRQSLRVLHLLSDCMNAWNEFNSRGKESKSVECSTASWCFFFLSFSSASLEASVLLARRISRLGHLRIRERNCRIIVIIPAVFSDPSSDTTVGGKLSLHQGKNRKEKRNVRVEKKKPTRRWLKVECIFVCAISRLPVCVMTL